MNKIKIKNLNNDIFVKIISQIISWIVVAIFLCLIGFIIYAAIPGFKKFGFFNIFCTTTYNLELNKASIWLPLCISLLTVFLATIIAHPLGVKSAIFIKFRLPIRYQKIIKICVELLADIPSVIFGLFVIEIFGPFTAKIFHFSTPYNLFNASLMLAFMILPTIISLVINALNSIDSNFLLAPMVLGNTKTTAIYKICKKQIKNEIIVAVIIAIARAFGETMAVSMILQSQSYNQIFQSGFLGIWNSYLKSLSCLIATNMFAESSNTGLQGLLFIFGLFLFLLIMILNALVTVCLKNKDRNKKNKFIAFLNSIIKFLPEKINQFINFLFLNLHIDKKNNKQYNLQQKQKNFIKKEKAYSYWKLFWEYVSFTLVMIFVLWIILDIIIFGIKAFTLPSNTVFMFGKNSTGQAIINTLLIIIIAIGIGLPISLAVAIYLNEFVNNSKIKNALLFFIDSLGATPSILFGMVGMIFFIQTLGLTFSGKIGKSLLAGTLTILLVILPIFIRTIQQALNLVPQELRTSSYALGVSRTKTIRKIVLPIAFEQIITAIALVIGRILAETAPLYLTSGLGSSQTISLLAPGQTLTTRIYAQIYNSNYNEGINIMYECAFITVCLILLILLIIDVFIPYYFSWKQKKNTNNKKNKDAVIILK